MHHMLQHKKSIVIGTVFILVISIGIFFAFSKAKPGEGALIKHFQSAEELRDYLTQHSNSSVSYSSMGGYMLGNLRNTSDAIIMADDMPTGANISPSARNPDMIGSIPQVNRFSSTNVQINGIDEPDIVKTNGKEIVVAPQDQDTYYDYSYSLKSEEKETGAIVIANAFPPETIKKLGEIKENGLLLLQDGILIVFTKGTITGYDISHPENAMKAWQITWKYETSELVTARLYNSKLYFVVQSKMEEIPCPVAPIRAQDKEVEIACNEIGYPTDGTSSPILLSSFRLDPRTGNIEQKNNFLGSENHSVVSMSEQALYITYENQPDDLTLFSQFLEEDGKQLFPESVIRHVEKLKSYDISSGEKLFELSLILQKNLENLKSADQEKKTQELRTALEGYVKRHKREISKTGILKIRLNDFKIAASGSVPGRLINQFALDEFEDHLRVATTAEPQGIMLHSISSGESANDVYILDKDLQISGSLLNLGLTERIYAVRFIGDRGYIVTFRQTDPFYVLDLSEPANPLKKGELKIPGFSSYLHPLEENLILGVGQENGKVKLSLFDVADPAKPVELAKSDLGESSSELLSNHHAFLHDPKHKVFFLPGYENGYVFSYANHNLVPVRKLENVAARRAVFINDLLYLLSNDELSVYDETSWEKVTTFDYFDPNSPQKKERRNRERVSAVSEIISALTAFWAAQGRTPACANITSTKGDADPNNASCLFKAWEKPGDDAIVQDDWYKLHIRKTPADPRKAEGKAWYYLYGHKADNYEFAIAATNEDVSGLSALVYGSGSDTSFLKSEISSSELVAGKKDCPATEYTIIQGESCIPYDFNPENEKNWLHEEKKMPQLRPITINVLESNASNATSIERISAIKAAINTVEPQIKISINKALWRVEQVDSALSPEERRTRIDQEVKTMQDDVSKSEKLTFQEKGNIIRLLEELRQ